jgi:hypothetical protein
MTPGERTLRARAAAYEMHAKHGSQKAALKGQAALLAKFERQIDPEGQLTPEERWTSPQEVDTGVMRPWSMVAGYW